MSITSAGGADAGGFHRLAQSARRAVLVPVLAIGAAVAALVAVTSLVTAPPRFVADPPSPAPSPSPWVEIVNPARAFALDSGIFGRDPVSVAARKNMKDGTRIDTLEFGAEAPGSRPWLLLQVHRYAEPSPILAPFVAEMARQAARNGFSIKTAGLPGSIPTRFGDAEIAEVQLDGNGQPSACLGFRLRNDQPGLALSGLACGTASKPLDRPALACALETLHPIAPQADVALARFFAASEYRRNPDCPAAQVPAAPAQRRAAAGQPRRR